MFKQINYEYFINLITKDFSMPIPLGCQDRPRRYKGKQKYFLSYKNRMFQQLK